MLLSRKRTCTTPPLSLQVDNCELSLVQCTKYLGILLNSEMSRIPHITAICAKARRLVGLLYCRFYKWPDPSTLLKLYIAYIRPHLEYCVCVWDPHLVKDVTCWKPYKNLHLRFVASNGLHLMMNCSNLLLYLLYSRDERQPDLCSCTSLSTSS